MFQNQKRGDIYILILEEEHRIFMTMVLDTMTTWRLFWTTGKR